MIPAGLVHALVSWASGTQSRIDQLKAERDQLVVGALTGGKASLTANSVSGNGKSFGFLLNLSPEEKLVVFNEALDSLGANPAAAAPVTLTYARFDNIGGSAFGIPGA